MFIKETYLTDAIKEKIFDGFKRDAICATGVDGLAEEAVSFEIFHDKEFVGALVARLFWGQLHIKYLFVEENYRKKGVARKLINHALEYGKQKGCSFAFVETMDFQAPDFYKKMGFTIELSREGYQQNTTLHYLKKNLNGSDSVKKISRIGVYGIITKGNEMLLVRQEDGPHRGKWDFPGGGIEFGETVEETLRRELLEEVGMEFSSMKLLANLTATINVNESERGYSYIFHQIGMLYSVEGCRVIRRGEKGLLYHEWVDVHKLTKDKCSSLLWQYIERLI